MNRIRPQLQQRPGFTLVELTVVVAIIGILAIISVFAWSGWRERTATTEVTNDLTAVAAAMDSKANWGEGYPVFAAGTVFSTNTAARNVFVPSTNVTLTYREGTVRGYCIEARSLAVPTVVMSIREDGGDTIAESGTC